MKNAAIAAVVVMLFCLGCADEGMSRKELASLKTSPRPTAEDMQRASEGMAKGAAHQKASELKWAAENPERLAKVNAERAKAGLRPLGR